MGIAVYISFARASPCLPAPQRIKGAQPKDCDHFDSRSYNLFELVSFEIYRGYSFEGTGRDLSDQYRKL